MNYSIDITVATKRDLADAFDYIDGMLMNPSAAPSDRQCVEAVSFARYLSTALSHCYRPHAGRLENSLLSRSELSSVLPDR